MFAYAGTVGVCVCLCVHGCALHQSLPSPLSCCTNETDTEAEKGLSVMILYMYK